MRYARGRSGRRVWVNCPAVATGKSAGMPAPRHPSGLGGCNPVDDGFEPVTVRVTHFGLSGVPVADRLSWLAGPDVGPHADEPERGERRIVEAGGPFEVPHAQRQVMQGRLHGRWFRAGQRTPPIRRVMRGLSSSSTAPTPQAKNTMSR